MIRKDDAKLSKMMQVGLWMIFGGIGLGLLGAMMTILSGSMVMMAITGVGGIAFVVGLVVVGTAVFGGLRTEKKAATSGEAVQIPDCQVTARFATNGVGETIFNEDDLLPDDPKVKYFVRIQPAQGRQFELRTSLPVWQSCGEGLRGTAVVQGDWLGAFRHEVGGGYGRPYG